MSSIIATVILVAISIAIAVAAAYWMGSSSGQYTGFERIEISSASCERDSSVTNARWMITVTMKNSGPTSSKVIYVLVNDDLVDDYDVSAGGSLTSVDSIGTSMSKDGVELRSGESGKMYIWIGSNLFSSGTSVYIKLHSVSGFSYIKLLTLT